MKVYVGHYGRRKYIAAVKTQKELAALLRSSVKHVRDYWAITGNEDFVARAMAEPHKLVEVEER